MFVRSVGSVPKSGLVRSGLRSRIGLALISVRIGSTKFFSGGAQFSKKKFGAMRSISSKNHWNRSHPRDFWAVRSLKISHAIFWQIRPIVPGFRRIWLQFDQIPGRSAEFTKKWHVDFSSCHMMILWHDDMMVCWYDDMMKIWWYYDDMMIWWHGDVMIREDDMMVWWFGDMVIWWFDEVMRWWCDDRMIWWYDDMMM